MAVYKPYRKTANGKEEIKIPYAILADPPTIPDISGKANLSGGNTFTGKQTLNSPASDGYSINAAGYIKGSWLQSSAISNKGANTGKVCVFDDSGWIYYRTPAEILTEAGGATTNQIPTVNNGTLTIKKNGTTVQTFSANQSGNVTANITFHLYEHSIYLYAHKTSGIYFDVYFTIITNSAASITYAKLGTMYKNVSISATGDGNAPDPEGTTTQFPASVIRIYHNGTYLLIDSVYNNLNITPIISNGTSAAYFSSSEVSITDKVRTIL